MSALSTPKNSSNTQAPSFKPLQLSESPVPRQWHSQHFMAVAAEAAQVELDYAAVMASRTELIGLFAEGDPWPTADLTLAEDRADLDWHHKEFSHGQSYAWSLLSEDRARCLGCLYLYPTANPGYSGEAYLWTSSGEPEHIRQTMETDVMAWLASTWPTTKLAWPGRTIPFNQWHYPNYYNVKRFA